jgi:hypothetical protein
MSQAVNIEYAASTGHAARATPAFSLSPVSANFGTAIRPRGTGEVAEDFIANTVIPANPRSNPVVVLDAQGKVLSATATQDPSINYNNTGVNSFSVNGSYTNGSSAPLANSGFGAVIATAIVSDWTRIDVSGQLGGESGSVQTFAPLIVPFDPEPGSIALLSAGAFVVFGRRGRRASAK